MIFNKNALKLAGIYLAIITFICIFFSISIYQISTQEVNRGIRGQGRPPIAEQEIDEQRQLRQIEHDYRISEANERIFSRLFFINIIIFIIGGILSYYFALKILKPIEDAKEAQSRFTADASHELRTPITAMRTETEVALMGKKLSSKDTKDLLESNIEELDKLSALTDELLSLSNFDSNTKDIIKTNFNVSKLIKDVCASIEPLANSKNINIKQNIENNTTITADAKRIKELSIILLDNAIKYSPNNSEITVSATINKNNFMLVVKDNGIGIPKTALPHIFDRFYRVDSSRTKQNISGHGLGLAIAYEIVKQHGGDISVKSTQNIGSTFSVSLPKCVVRAK